MYQNICEPKHSQPTCYPQEDMWSDCFGKNNREVSELAQTMLKIVTTSKIKRDWLKLELKEGGVKQLQIVDTRDGSPLGH